MADRESVEIRLPVRDLRAMHMEQAVFVTVVRSVSGDDQFEVNGHGGFSWIGVVFFTELILISAVGGAARAIEPAMILTR